MADDADPPRKAYGFKPTDFARANPPRPEADSGPANHGAGLPAERGPIDVRDLARQATTHGRLLDGTNAAANRANEVHAILRENHAHAVAQGLHQLKPAPPRSTRRRRDYVMALLFGNAVLIVCTFLSPVFGGAGLIIYNVGLTWIVWGVMDPY